MLVNGSDWPSFLHPLFGVVDGYGLDQVAGMDEDELFVYAKKIQAPFSLLQASECAALEVDLQSS